MDQIYTQLTAAAESSKSAGPHSLSFSNSLHVLKPLSVEWAVNSWLKLKDRTDLIIKAWRRSFNLVDPMDKEIQKTASERVMKGELMAYGMVPGEVEEIYDAQYYNCDTDSESDKDELDVMKRRVEGTRKSSRKRTAPRVFGYQINTTQIHLADGSGSGSEIE